MSPFRVLHPRGLLTFVFFTLLIGPPTGRAAEEVINFRYDAALRVISADVGAGKRIEYAYDAAGNVLSRSVRDFTDSDNDGLDDTWENTNFGSLARDGRADFDNDRSIDLAEFLAGTNPKDSNSVLRVTLIKQAVVARIQWPAQAGVRYRVQYTDSITNPAWRQLGEDVIGSGATAQKDDPGGFSSQSRFYRVMVAQ